MAVSISRRSLLCAAAFAPGLAWSRYRGPDVPVFDVSKYGAVGDGSTPSTAAFQRAINAAAASGSNAQVLVRSGKYVIGTIELKANIDFHLADGAVLLASFHREDYRGEALITADAAHGLSISGGGMIDGRAKEFMASYDEAQQIWVPRDWRPKLFALSGCHDLSISDINIQNAPYWGLHILGCDGVVVDGVKIHNMLDVPNCDGIDPDRCRNVVIRKCHVISGDDAIVIKSSRQKKNYGVSENIVVRDCVVDTQDAGLKIGTETVGDIRDIRFENCEIRNSGRGLCIQLRDEGNISDVEFRNIKLKSRYFSDPWWGRGEAISFTAIPRSAGSKVGKLHTVRVSNIAAKSENSVRISGSMASVIANVTLDNVAVNMERWTSYPGPFFDNRPTKAQREFEKVGTPGFYIHYADNVTLQNCSVTWAKNPPEYFTYAVEARDVKHLNIERLKGHAAHPGDKTTSIS